MSPFWNSFVEHVSGRGKNATLFLVALGGFFGLLIGAAFLDAAMPPEYRLPVVIIFGAIILIWAGRLVRRIRMRRHLSGRTLLSDDELTKARCKLQSRPRLEHSPK